MAKGSVFLIGAGFIGGEILDALVQEGYQISALVRRQNAADEFKAMGVTPVMGSLEDGDLITEQTVKHDVVLHTATADDQPSVDAVVKGLKQRASNGKKTIYIHTSGCSELSDLSAGDYESDTIFHDDKPAEIDAIPADAPHREVDLSILKAREELGQDAKIAIVLPPVVYGVGARSKRLSIQYPTLTRFAIKHGFAPHVGKGLSVWNTIHVADLAQGYVTILHWLESNSSDDIYANPYFFVENGDEYSWKQAAEHIGKALHDVGKIADPTPKTIPEDLYGDIFGIYTAQVAGSNARNRANRLRSLGWKAQQKSAAQSLVEDEIPLILQDEKEFAGYSAAVASGSGYKK